jgi:hypothetical protein
MGALACVLFGGGPSTARGQEKLGPWTVEYDTKTLTVEAVNKSVRTPYTFDLKLRNTSGRPINAIGLSVGSYGLRSHVDFVAEGKDLEPGATYEFGLMPRSQDEAGPLRVTAVLFADGSADGDPADIEYMRFSRLGETLESARWLGVLQGLGRSQLDDTTIRRLLTSRPSAPKSVDEALSSFTVSLALRNKLQSASAQAVSGFLTGIAARKSMCSAYLEQPASSREKGAARLSGLVTRLERSTAALRASSQRDMGVEE